MTCLLTALATELQLLIFDSLQESGDSRKSFINLSSTCSMFRSLLAPNVFETVTLRNTEKSAALALAIVGTHTAQYVKKLEFKAQLLENRSTGPYSYFASRPLLHESTRKILANLYLFPCLDTLSIHFVADKHIPDVWEALDYGESIGEALQMEKEKPWRRLIAKTYQTLSQNKFHSIRTLLLPDTIPLGVSTFTSPSFHGFLSTLENFTMSLLGGDKGLAQSINTAGEGYADFVKRLPVFVFSSLKSVKKLSIISTMDGVLGPTQSRFATAFPLAKMFIPHLESLHLEHMFICDALLQFLNTHAKTLRRISLRHCFGNYQKGEYCFRWSHLLEGITRTEHKVLASFEIEPPQGTRAYLPEHIRYEVSQSQEFLNVLRNEPYRRIFAYGKLDERWGTLKDCEGDNIDAFLDGGDQRAYDRLMAVISTEKSKHLSTLSKESGCTRDSAWGSSL